MTITHDHPLAGHPGRDKTIRKAKQLTQWDGMNQWISDYIKGCATCQQNKILTHRRKTPLYRITTKEGTLPFQQVAMDLITGLPTHKGKDAILTIVDHGCSRGAIFLPCSTTVMGPGIAQLYLDNMYRWFGLPLKIITNRDPHFTSHFGKALKEKLGIQQNLSSAFHPQTDGISERKNQWVEQYLHLVTSAQPEDWMHWLPLASAVHNNRKNATTGLSPNQIILGYEPTLLPSETPPSSNEAVQERVKLLMQRRAQAVDAINQTAGKSQTIPSQFKCGNQVWLEATNLKFPHQKTKLLPKRYGPFTITKEISPVAYQIKLPPSWNIHNVFHASLLSPYHETTAHGPNFSRPPPDLIKGEEEYEVERIISHRRHGRSRTLQYLIKWKGYPESDNTWEPHDQVHAPELLKTYHRQNPLQGIKGRSIKLDKTCPSSQSRSLPSHLGNSYPMQPAQSYPSNHHPLAPTSLLGADTLSRKALTSSPTKRLTYSSRSSATTSLRPTPIYTTTSAPSNTTTAPSTTKACLTPAPSTCPQSLAHLRQPQSLSQHPSLPALSTASYTTDKTSTPPPCEASQKDWSTLSRSASLGIKDANCNTKAASTSWKRRSSTIKIRSRPLLRDTSKTMTRSLTSSSPMAKAFSSQPNGSSSSTMDTLQDTLSGTALLTPHLSSNPTPPPHSTMKSQPLPLQYGTPISSPAPRPNSWPSAMPPLIWMTGVSLGRFLRFRELDDHIQSRQAHIRVLEQEVKAIREAREMCKFRLEAARADKRASSLQRLSDREPQERSGWKKRAQFGRGRPF